MIEANMYGLPFYSFGGTPQHTPPAVTPPTHARRGWRRHGASAGGRRLQHPGQPGQRRHLALLRPAAAGRLDVHRRRRPVDDRHAVGLLPAGAADGLARRDRARHESRTASGCGPHDPHDRQREAVQAVPARRLEEREAGQGLPEHLLPGGRGERQPRRRLRRPARHGRRSTSAASSRTSTGDLTRAPSRSWTRRRRHRLLELERLHAAARSSRRARSRRATSITAFVRVADDAGLSRVAILYHESGDGPLERRAARPRERRPLDEDVHHRELEPDPARLGGRGPQRQRRLQLQQGRQLPVGARHGRDAPVDLDRRAAARAGPGRRRSRSTSRCQRSSRAPSSVGISSAAPAPPTAGLPIQSGGLLDTSKPGVHTFTVAAEDVAGHASDGKRSATWSSSSSAASSRRSTIRRREQRQRRAAPCR